MKEHRVHLLLLILCCSTALPLTLLVCYKPIWIDEIATLAQLEPSLLQSIHNMIEGVHSSWLYTPFLWLLYPLSFDWLHLYRIPGMLFLWGASYYFFLSLYEITKCKTGAIFYATFFIVAYPMIYWSTEARPYSAGMATLAYLFWQLQAKRLVQNPTRQILFGLICSFALWLHPFHIFSVIPLCIIFLWQCYEGIIIPVRGSIVRVGISFGIPTLILMVTVLSDASARLSDQEALMPVAATIISLIVGFATLSQPMPFLLLILLYGVSYQSRKELMQHSKERSFQYLVLWLVVASCLMAMSEKFLNKVILYDRHFLQIAFPAMMLFFSLYHKNRHRIKVIVLIYFVVSSGLYTSRMIATLDYGSSELLAHQLKQMVAQDDVILFSSPVIETSIKNTFESHRYRRAYLGLPHLYHLPGTYLSIPYVYQSFEQFASLVLPLITENLHKNASIVVVLNNQRAINYLRKLSEGRYTLDEYIFPQNINYVARLKEM